MTSSLVRAGGGIPWRRSENGDVEVLLVHRPRYGDWTFPKGKADPGESDAACAVRETLEETGLEVELGPELVRSEYVDARGRPKCVRYWAMTVAGGTFQPNAEVDRIVWLPLAQASVQLSYPRDQPVLASLAELLADDGGSAGRQ